MKALAVTHFNKFYFIQKELAYVLYIYTSVYFKSSETKATINQTRFLERYKQATGKVPLNSSLTKLTGFWTTNLTDYVYCFYSL